MGKKDAVSKHYMSKNEIFADAVNFYFFDGKEKVKPEDLESGDPEELELLYGKHAAVHAVVEQEKNREKGKRKHKRRDSDLISVQRYRDILKRCVIREYGRTVYVIYGIEAQSEIHYAMPVRIDAVRRPKLCRIRFRRSRMDTRKMETVVNLPASFCPDFIGRTACGRCGRWSFTSGPRPGMGLGR